jgi:hypothetical protein
MSLNLYSSRQEEMIDIRRRARTWYRSGLISEDQMQSILRETDPDLHQTNLFFRVLFFVFTLLFAGAVAGLFGWLMEKAGNKILAMVVLFFGIFYFILAEHLVKIRRLYRYGIEEALLIAGMVCFVISFLMGINDHHLDHKTISIAVCLLFSVISCLIYLRFGYLYAALIGLVAGCMIPFQLSLSPVAERIVLFFVLCGMFIFSQTVDKPENENFRKERYTIIQTCLLIAVYLTVNLQIPGLAGLFIGETGYMHDLSKMYPPYLYWISYVLTFMIPAAGILWGIRSRKRLVLTAGLVMACVTLATNKSYLGLTRYAWDPAILGIVLVVLSILVHRWLDSGPGKKRQEYTAVNLLKPEDRGISIEDVAAAMTAGAVEDHQPKAQQDALFQGGKSGGGGASRNF